MLVFKILDVNNDKRISESDLFQVMRFCSSKSMLTEELAG